LEPTVKPSARPTVEPTIRPTVRPTVHPTAPTVQPTVQPTVLPSSTPTRKPAYPSGQPTGIPTQFPSNQPIGEPSRQPSSRPTLLPTSQPSGVPLSNPTQAPSTSLQTAIEIRFNVTLQENATRIVTSDQTVMESAIVAVITTLVPIVREEGYVTVVDTSIIAPRTINFLGGFSVSQGHPNYIFKIFTVSIIVRLGKSDILDANTTYYTLKNETEAIFFLENQSPFFQRLKALVGDQQLIGLNRVQFPSYYVLVIIHSSSPTSSPTSMPTCTAGDFTDGHHKKVGVFVSCNKCPPGSFSSMDSLRCEVCPIGTYADKFGSSYCNICPFPTYTAFPGSSSCGGIYFDWISFEVMVLTALVLTHFGFIVFSFNRANKLYQENEEGQSHDDYIIFNIILLMSFIDVGLTGTYLVFGIFASHSLFISSLLCFLSPLISFGSILMWSTGMVSLVKCKTRFLKVFFFIYPSQHIIWLTNKYENPATDDGMTDIKIEPYFKLNRYDTLWKLVILAFLWAFYLLYQFICLIIFLLWCFAYAIFLFIMFIPFALFYQSKCLHDMALYTKLLNIWIWRADDNNKEKENVIIDHSKYDYADKDDEGNYTFQNNMSERFDYAILNVAITADVFIEVGFVIIIAVNSTLVGYTNIDLICSIVITSSLCVKLILYIVTKWKYRRLFKDKTISWATWWYSGLLFEAVNGNKKIRNPHYSFKKRIESRIQDTEKVLEDYKMFLGHEIFSRVGKSKTFEIIKIKVMVFSQYLGLLRIVEEKFKTEIIEEKKITASYKKRLEKMALNLSKSFRKKVVELEDAVEDIYDEHCVDSCAVFCETEDDTNNSDVENEEDIIEPIEEIDEYKDFLKELDGYLDGFEDLLAYVIYSDNYSHGSAIALNDDFDSIDCANICFPYQLYKSFENGFGVGYEVVADICNSDLTAYKSEKNDEGIHFNFKKEAISYITDVYGDIYTLPPSDIDSVEYLTLSKDEDIIVRAEDPMLA